jgi:hypothetical protein
MLGNARKNGEMLTPTTPEFRFASVITGFPNGDLHSEHFPGEAREKEDMIGRG